ncbi:MAG: short chain dehydrogenase [Chitinophagaceae bacterium]|nr:short chain dehydrogenase [Chitinophagaceae bacterium]
MKILIIGAGGAIGKIITPALQVSHEVITAGRNNGDIIADISSTDSIENLFTKVSNIDAVICAAGDSISDNLSAMEESKYSLGLNQKLLAQINLVLIGLKFLNKNGSFTLISGKMGERPAKGSSGKAVANGAVNSFVLSAALEMPKGIRINAVSPSKISDISSTDLINAYLKSIGTATNGEIIRIGYN